MDRELRLFSRAASADPGQNLILGTVGPLFVAYLLSWALYGTLSVQSYVYYLAFPKDKPLHKWLVLAVYLIETVDIIIMTYDVMADFRDVFHLWLPPDQRSSTYRIQFSWLRIYILGAIVTCIVQLYYARHLNLLQRPRAVTLAIIATAFLQCCGSIVSGALQAKHNFYVTAVQNQVPIPNYIFGAASVICSITVSAAMTHELMYQDTEWKKRHPFLPKLIRVTIETGIVAALAAVSYFVLFFTRAHALNLMIPALVLSKIYANSLLVVFNSRMNIIRGRIPAAEGLGSLVFPKTENSATFRSNARDIRTELGSVRSAVIINITTTSVVSRPDSVHIPNDCKPY